jgi:hypothetical protein
MVRTKGLTTDGTYSPFFLREINTALIAFERNYFIHVISSPSGATRNTASYAT